MKAYLLSLTVFAGTMATAMAQNYQTQYPYDPYSSAPTPQSYQTYGNTQTSSSSSSGYHTPSSGGYGDYSKQSNYSGGANYGTSRFAQLLSWGHLEAHYAYHDFRGDNRIDGDSGFGINLRAKLMNPVFLHFGLDRITGKGPRGRDLEMTSFSAGGGLYVPLGQRVHLYGEVGVRLDWTDDDYDHLNPDDASLYVRPGIRWAVTEDFELTASVLFYNTDNLNDRVVEVSGYYALLDWLDIGGGVDFGSDINTYRIGGRWRW